MEQIVKFSEIWAKISVLYNCQFLVVETMQGVIFSLIKLGFWWDSENQPKLNFYMALGILCMDTWEEPYFFKKNGKK